MLEQDALVSVDDANDLAEKINGLLLSPPLRDKYSENALKFAAANKGALQRLLAGINNHSVK
jgi:3-deoxy-D-manno-octulosonic-acid transferase